MSVDFFKKYQTLILEAEEMQVASPGDTSQSSNAQTGPVDCQGVPIIAGARVAIAAKLYVKDGLHIVIKTVSAVNGNKVYIDGSRQPLRFPDRICVVK